MNTLKHSEKVMKVSAQKAEIVKPKVLVFASAYNFLHY
jgi:hypothetical protein